MEPFALNAGEGWTYRYGIDFVVKSGEMNPGRGCAFTEYVTKKGEEPPDHTHRTEDEIFYVAKGAVSFHCAGKEFELSEGGFVYLPKGIKHGYKILSDGEVRLIAITFPVIEAAGTGWGGFVADMEKDAELVSQP